MQRFKTVTRAVAMALVAGSMSAAAFAQTPELPLPAPPFVPTPGSDVSVMLKTGETLVGKLIQSTADSVTVAHPVLGTIVLPADKVTGVGPPPPPGTPPPAPKPPPPPPKEWSFSGEVGLNGTSGNTEALSLHAGFGVKRIKPLDEFNLFFRYDYTNSDGDTTVNKAKLFAREEWILGEGSKWRFFIDGAAEYDQFQDWDWRLSGHAGFGYELIKNDKTTLIGRVGVGAYRKIGDSDNNIRPEGLLGIDWEQKIAENQKFTLSVDFLPALDEFGPYRLIGRAGYEILLDPSSNLSLKLGAEDEYDSRPGEGKNRNDITYFAALVLAF